MVRRSRDWNDGLSKDLKNPDFARGFFLEAIEEGIPLQLVLSKVIRGYGIREYAEKIGMASSNLVRTLRPNHNLTVKALLRLLEPLGLSVTVCADNSKRRKKVA